MTKIKTEVLRITSLLPENRYHILDAKEYEDVVSSVISKYTNHAGYKYPIWDNLNQYISFSDPEGWRYIRVVAQ